MSFLLQMRAMLVISAPITYILKNIEAQVDTSCTISNFDLELLGRSELRVQCTKAFKRSKPLPRSTKYFPFFSFQLHILPFYRTINCCNVIIWSKQAIQLLFVTNHLCHFTNLPFTSCILRHNFLTTLVLNILNVWPSLNTRDQDCKINNR